MTKKTKHLDVGCGRDPRNPFNCDELHGVDIVDKKKIRIFLIRKLMLF
jgi:hypothetical protein